MKTLLASTALAVLLPLGLACAATAAEIKAVASFSILGDMVKQVGGDRVAVTTIVGPDADTHVYEPTPSDAKAVAGSDVFFINGLGFEGWMDRFVGATGYAGPLVTVSDGVKTHSMDEDGETVTDPHAWQSLKNGVLYVHNIARGLCAVDADGCTSYEANADAYAARLEALDAEVRTRIEALPEASRKVITTHDAFGYFAEAYGVAFLAAEGVSTEADPSAADVARLILQIKADGIKAVFIENMTDGRLIEQIAKEAGVTPGGELYADALSPADGPAATYLDMFRYNVDMLVTAMAEN